jgi:hypothetical protein
MEQFDMLAKIREVHTHISWFEPFRDLGLVPHPAASRVAIERAEARIGRALPPSYRAFLRRHDGWPRFFEGASLLGTANLGVRAYDELARAVFEAAETPVPDLGPPSRRRTYSLVPFGADMEGTTLFAFNAAAQSQDGEYEVIAWVNEIGVRRDSFAAFLEFVLELSEADLHQLTAGPLAAAG